MMNKKGSVVVLLIFLIVVILTSAFVLLLVRFDVLDLKPDSEKSILNTEFLPIDKEGMLEFSDVATCNYVDDDFYCLDERDTFTLGEEIHVRTAVRSQGKNGVIILTRNYEVRDSFGEVLFAQSEENKYQVEGKYSGEPKTVVFADYFPTVGLEAGRYEIDVIVENPLFENKITKTMVVKVE